MSFIDFFKRKPPEIEILDLLNKHLDLCIKATDLLNQALKYKQEEKQTEASKLIKEIKAAEEEADYRRREIINKLAHGILPPISKEDMMELVKLLDNVIDWTDESAQLLNTLDIHRIPKHIRDFIIEQQKLGNQCIHTLRETIVTLNEDYDQALDKCNLVEIIEHEMDNTYLQIHEAIYRTQLSVNDAILIKQLADYLENVGDSCEDTADLVRVVVVSAFR